MAEIFRIESPPPHNVQVWTDQPADTGVVDEIENPIRKPAPTTGGLKTDTAPVVSARQFPAAASGTTATANNAATAGKEPRGDVYRRVALLIYKATFARPPVMLQLDREARQQKLHHRSGVFAAAFQAVIGILQLSQAG
jgi:hypothetical protein